MMLSGVLMLRHLGERDAADRLEQAIADVIAEGKDVTYDLKPTRTTRPPSAPRRWRTPSSRSWARSVRER